MKPNTPFNYEYDEPHLQDMQANLQAAVSKLFYYDTSDLDSAAFERNFRECQLMFEELNRAIDED